MTLNRDNIIDHIRHISAKLLPEGTSVFLFGSQARGDYSDNSDWDLLILLNKKGSLGITDRGQYTFPIYELGAEMDIEINPVIYTETEWEKRSFTPFYKNVVNDRIRIWG